MRSNAICAAIVTALILTGGCTKNEITMPALQPPQGHLFEIRAWDYATNYFFVDTVYRSQYEPYYLSDPPVVHAGMQIIDEEVWVERIGVYPDPTERPGVAFVDLPARPAQGYDSTFHGTRQIPGEVEAAIFVRLSPEEYDMCGDRYTGMIALRTPVADQQTVAIAYRRADGSQFGDFARDLSDSADFLILKMVKPRNLAVNPQYHVAWKQLVKSVYIVGARDLVEGGFEMRVLYNPRRADQIFARPLLHVLGLDRFNADHTVSPGGDGLFDFRPGRTLDPRYGEIIFPYLEPFNGRIKRHFEEEGIHGQDQLYCSPMIYDTTKAAARWMEGGKYSLFGRVLQ
jgi:hypothetical protein